MKYKKIDPQVRKVVVGYVKLYKTFIRQLAQEREQIIQGGAKPPDGQPRGTMASDTTADKVVRLEALENCHKARVVAAIDAAKLTIGLDIQSINEEQRLKQAIWLSTQHYEIGFHELSKGICVSERDFYRRKARFISDIANNLGI